jgi:hypothetical protein
VCLVVRLRRCDTSHVRSSLCCWRSIEGRMLLAMSVTGKLGHMNESDGKEMRVEAAEKWCGT